MKIRQTRVRTSLLRSKASERFPTPSPNCQYLSFGHWLQPQELSYYCHDMGSNFTPGAQTLLFSATVYHL